MVEFYQTHHCGWRKAALGFGPDRIRTDFSMVTDNNAKNCVATFSRLFFHPILFRLVGNQDM